MNSIKLKSLVPFFLILILLAILTRELFYKKPYEIPSALIDSPVPTFELPDLMDGSKIFSNKDLTGKVMLLNIWATWCYACTLEHEMLMKIQNVYHVPIYSIVYKDDREKALNWLALNGNPFVLTGDDKKGDVAIDLGVYGTPETFVINAQGKIVYRHVGLIDQQTWDNILYPLVRKYSA